MIDRRAALVVVMSGRGLVPFTDNFASLSSRWTGAGFAVGSGVATVSPTQGSELAVDGGMENWTSPTDLTSWTEAIAGTSTINQDTDAGDIHGGSSAARMDVDASNTVARLSQVILTANSWYHISLWLKTITGSPTLNIGDNSAVGVPAKFSPILTDTYTQRFGGFRATMTTFAITRNSMASKSAFIDDISIKALTVATVFATVEGGASNVTAQVKVTSVDKTKAGLVVCLDSTTTPLNYITAFVDSTNACLEECVNGVTTNKISGNITYVAGALLQVVKNGTTCQLFYNGSQVGTDQTMTANTNTKHGLFSTYAGNTFDDFALANP